MLLLSVNSTRQLLVDSFQRDSVKLWNGTVCQRHSHRYKVLSLLRAKCLPVLLHGVELNVALCLLVTNVLWNLRLPMRL